MFLASFVYVVVCSTAVLGVPLVSDPESPNSRIIGGTEAIPHEFPYIVSLKWVGGPFCSGVLITPRALLTSAMCSEFVNVAFYMQVIAGRHNLSDSTEETLTQQKNNGSQIIRHSGYPAGPNGHLNDIAIVVLQSEYQMNENVDTIPLPSPGQISSGMGVILGWGSSKEEEISYQDMLMKSDVPILSDDECSAIYGEDFDPNSMICAGDIANGGVDTCNGDLGGPLLGRKEDGSLFLAGISSWGQGCGKPGFPGVYTEVATFLEFIEQNVDIPSKNLTRDLNCPNSLMFLFIATIYVTLSVWCTFIT